MSTSRKVDQVKFHTAEFNPPLEGNEVSGVFVLSGKDI